MANDDHWISKKIIKKTKSVKIKDRSPTAKGYSEGIESGFASANTQARPRVNYTGKKNVSNLFKSKEYKHGFNKGRTEAVKMVQKEIKVAREMMGLKPQMDIRSAYSSRIKLPKK